MFVRLFVFTTISNIFPGIGGNVLNYKPNLILRSTFPPSCFQVLDLFKQHKSTNKLRPKRHSRSQDNKQTYGRLSHALRTSPTPLHFLALFLQFLFFMHSNYSFLHLNGTPLPVRDACSFILNCSLFYAETEAFNISRVARSDI